MRLSAFRIFPMVLVVFWIISMLAYGQHGVAQSAAAVQATPPLAAPALAPANFVDVNETAGINAPHHGSWDEYYAQRDFTDGYLAMGQAWGDYDNDGWPDLYVTGGQGPSVLYHNQGDGTFQVAPQSASVSLPNTWTGGATWTDYDNDGWPDLYVLAHGANVLFHNDEGVGFADVTATAAVGDPGKSSTATWGDFNGDGYLDLYVTNWSCYPACDPVDNSQAQDHLYQSNGPNGQGIVTFTDVSHQLTYAKLLGDGFSATFIDIDDDRDPDLYVVNDKLQNPIGNVLWRNDGPDKEGQCGGWCWTDISESSGANTVLHGMGLAIGDYDEDLDLDFYFTDMVDPGKLLQNDGTGNFRDITAAATLSTTVSDAVGWGTAFFDYDNDGRLDLYYATTRFVKFNDLQGPLGMHFPFQDFLFHNAGGTFSETTPPAWQANPQPTMGMAYADYDGDGRVDFVSGTWNEGYHLHRNEDAAAATNNWLAIKLIGGGPVNRDAVGTRVYVNLTGDRHLMQEVTNGSALGAGNDLTLHFGLAQERVISVLVVWPDGLSATFADLSVNQRWQLTYPDTSGAIEVATEAQQPPSPLIQKPVASAPLLLSPTAPLSAAATSAPLPTATPSTMINRASLSPSAPLYVSTPLDDDATLATAWFDLYLELIETTDGFTPPVAARAIGYGSVTLYEALVPALPGYQSLVGQLNGLQVLPAPIANLRYDWPTVANSAISAITGMLFNNTTVANKDAIALLELQFAEQRRPLLDAATFDRSAQYGRALAVVIYSWSVTDGGHDGQLRNFPDDYMLPVGGGLWESTPPGYATALQPSWGNNRPLAISADHVCDAPPPTPYSETVGSPFYQLAQEVYDTVRLLTPEQRIIARYWADDPGRTLTPPGHSLAVTTQILQQTGASLSLAAETYARVGIALNDAFIGCWQTKYQYNRIRPITYIHAQIDPTWNDPDVTDPVITPPFPEYTSGHSVQSGAVAEILTSLFGTVTFTDRTHTAHGLLPRTYHSFWQMANEAAISRLYGGIHYRDAIESGLVQGQCIGQQVVALHFRTQ